MRLKTSLYRRPKTYTLRKMHIIEELIVERAPTLSKRKLVWPLIRPGLYKLLGYKKAVRMADAMMDMNGYEAFSYGAEAVNAQPQVSGLENIPATGPVIIISNHPTGLADGIFVHEVLKARRPDHIFMANADALRVLPKGRDIIIPVEWVMEKRTAAKTKMTLRDLNAALAAGKAVVIFPSGVLAKLTWRGLTDKVWNATAVNVARKHKVPIVPLRIKARNSGMYYLFSFASKQLRDITLFYELLNKRGTKPKLKFGPVIDPASLPRGAEATAKVRTIVETL